MDLSDRILPPVLDGGTASPEDAFGPRRDREAHSLLRPQVARPVQAHEVTA